MYIFLAFPYMLLEHVEMEDKLYHELSKDGKIKYWQKEAEDYKCLYEKTLFNKQALESLVIDLTAERDELQLQLERYMIEELNDHVED